MEKYATYNIFMNKDTKEIKRIPLHDQQEMTKLANMYNWELIDKEPEENEQKRPDNKESRRI